MMSNRELLEMENTEYDCGHDVCHEPIVVLHPMKVKDIIARLKMLPEDLEVVRFDGESVEPVTMIYVYPGGIYDARGKVVID